jgi:long-chain acyl-CoA synthetase
MRNPDKVYSAGYAMTETRKTLTAGAFREDSIPAIELNTYLRHWDRITFLSREKDGVDADRFIPMRAGEFLEKQIAIASGLLDLGVRKEDRVAVFAENSVRYAITVFAILSAGAVFVPIYPTTTAVEAEHIVYHSSAKCLFVGHIAQLQKSLPFAGRVKSPVKKVITLYPDRSSDGLVGDFDTLLTQGARAGRADDVVASVRALTRDDTAVLLYTLSSLTNPRGALLSHGNFLSQRALSDVFGITHEDTRLAHLPFGHIFGLVADLFASAACGSTLCITRTFDTTEILRYIGETSPTIICSVPRLYEKMYVDFVHMINSRPRMVRGLYRHAIKKGRDCFVRECNGAHTPASRLTGALMKPVYRSIRRSLGLSNTRLLISAAGQLPSNIAHIAGGVGLPIIEGYGLTETLPIINVNPPGKIKPGTQGPPVDSVVEKFSHDGEILVKGPTVFQGYFNNPAENEAAFTPDGFYRTGDTGHFDEDGYLVLTGRLKDRILLSSGRDVRPRNIEKHFEREFLFDYFCVVGDGRAYTAALVCPNFTALRQYARDHHIEFTEERELAHHPEIERLFKKKIDEVNGLLASYEQVRKFKLMPERFTIESGEITPTFKLRRLFIHEKYRDVIDSMYPSSVKAIDGV